MYLGTGNGINETNHENASKNFPGCLKEKNQEKSFEIIFQRT